MCRFLRTENNSRTKKKKRKQNVDDLWTVLKKKKEKKRKNLVVCMTSIVYRHEKERGRLAFLSYSFVFPCTFSFGFSSRLITQSFNLRPTEQVSLVFVWFFFLGLMMVDWILRKQPTIFKSAKIQKKNKIKEFFLIFLMGCWKTFHAFNPKL
jgi:hypothetical protein